jgi:predicted HTH transcriptional regulator
MKMGYFPNPVYLTKDMKYYLWPRNNIAALTNMYMVTLHNKRMGIYFDNVIFPSQWLQQLYPSAVTSCSNQHDINQHSLRTFVMVLHSRIISTNFYLHSFALFIQFVSCQCANTCKLYQRNLKNFGSWY